jgi:hypothetical protein
MNAEDQIKAAGSDDPGEAEPGMAAALLAVVVMILSTSVLALLIYVVMIAVVPIEPRQVKKPDGVLQPFPQPQEPARTPN